MAKELELTSYTHFPSKDTYLRFGIATGSTAPKGEMVEIGTALCAEGFEKNRNC